MAADRKRVLLITASRAEPAVRAAVTDQGTADLDVEVRAAPKEVAALLTTDEMELIARDGAWDLVMVPGLVRGDVRELERRTGVPTVRGPRYAFDIPDVLARHNDLALSPDVPACDLMEHGRAERARRVLGEVEGEMAEGPCYEIKGVRLGRGLPVRVVAEICDCDDLPTKLVVATAKRFVHDGADIIDLGFRVEGDRDKAAQLVEAVLPLGVPVSVDTLDPAIINAAVDAGAHMVLSLHPDNLELVRPTDAVWVVVPGKGDKVDGVLATAERARRRGFERLVLDPVLDPAVFGLTRSIAAYERLSRTTDLPVLMGIGNATELMDADSPGANAVLCAIAQELGVAALLTTEASDKTSGSVRECRVARDMMAVAARLGSYPKDLGIALLSLKDKRTVHLPPTSRLAATVPLPRPVPYEKGVEVRIGVTEDGRIRCLVLRDDEEQVLLEGTSARELWSEVLVQGLVRNLDHAAYLGSELARAEEAIAANKGYVQDIPLFRGKERPHWE